MRDNGLRKFLELLAAAIERVYDDVLGQGGGVMPDPGDRVGRGEEDQGGGPGHAVPAFAALAASSRSRRVSTRCGHTASCDLIAARRVVTPAP